MIQVNGYAALTANAPLVPFAFERREPGPHDVQIEILYAGVCHSDLHQAHADWGAKIFPMVPGHEIVGRVVAVGEHVNKVKVGDHAGIGCMVDSCRHCSACNDDLEQYCEEGATLTYNDMERDKVTPPMAAIRTRSSSRNASSSTSPKRSTCRARHLCSARVSPAGRRCAIGRSAPVTRSE